MNLFLAGAPENCFGSEVDVLVTSYLLSKDQCSYRNQFSTVNPVMLYLAVQSCDFHVQEFRRPGLTSSRLSQGCFN